MKKCVYRALLIILGACSVFAVGGVSFPHHASANAKASTWANRPVYARDLGDAPQPRHLWAPCGGVDQRIFIRSYSAGRAACVFGSDSSLRLARYQDDVGVYRYAVALSGEAVYSQLDNFCLSCAGCSYASASDAVLSQSYISPIQKGTTLHLHFSKQIERRIDAFGIQYFVFLPSREGMPIKMGQTMLSSNATTFSDNGKWALVELEAYGVMRVNVETGVMRRIDAPGGVYGMANNPFYDFVITDDGRHVAIVGYRLGLDVIEVRDGCGDELVEGQSRYWFVAATPCVHAQIDRYQLFPDFQYAADPRFANGDEFLSVTVVQANARKRVLLSVWPPQNIDAYRYVALGDSFTSGEGETLSSHYLPSTNTKTNRCHVSDRSYPYLAAGVWQVHGVNGACSGARASQIMSNSLAGKGQLELIRNVQPSIISISIGGNDAGLMDKLRGCLSASTCEWATDTKKRGPVLRELQATIPKLTALINLIHRDVPASRIILIGYPQIVATAKDARCGFVKTILLDEDERLFMDETIRYLNQVIRAVADANGVQYVDVERAFEGERLCEGGSKAMNGIRFGSDAAPISALPSLKIIGSESFHPLPAGHERLAAVITKQYPDPATILSACFECVSDAVVPTASKYWYIDDTYNDKTVYRSLEFLEKSIYKPLERLRINLERVFMPGALVKVEVHSLYHTLGEATADSDGNFQYEGILPEGLEPGYHSVHLLGVAPNNDPIDIYTTFWLAEDESPPPSTTTVFSRLINHSRGQNSNAINTTRATVTMPIEQVNGLVSVARKLLQIPFAGMGAAHTELPTSRERSVLTYPFIYVVIFLAVGLGILFSIVLGIFLIKRRYRGV